MNWPLPWRRPAPQPDPAPEPVRAVSESPDPLTALGYSPEIALSKGAAWNIYRCRLTGAVVRALVQEGSGRVLDPSGSPTPYSPGDYIVKPFGSGPRRVVPRAEFEERFELTDG